MCFTSPMTFTKSILRPVRATTKGGAASLAFLRRHFRTSGGCRASTFFTITGKKRGGALETHEPSSPKVTCIGQVRVKSKKRVKQCRRRIGEVSFRMAEQSYGGGGSGQRIEDADKVWIRRQRFSNSGSQSHRDQRWVHLPVSVCAALRAFRAEICCFFPCKCCCFPTRGKEGNTKSGCYPDENGCGAVFPRWLVAVNGGEGRKRREIEVVVTGEERSEMMSLRSSRRHVFEGFEVKDLVGEEEEGARVSICIPPKNALLLMRCRSDPMKMAALENAARKHENGDIEEDNDGKEKESVIISEEKEQEIEENDEEEVDEFGDVSEQESTTVLSESIESCERNEKERGEQEDEEEEETEELSEDKTQINSEPEKPILHEEEITHSERERPIQEEEETQIHSERESTIDEGEEEKPVMAIINQDIKKENKSGGGLPECLLLMMCEPKLSMEVSKETWVRGTDFIRLLPERPRKPPKTAAAGETVDQEPVKRRPSIDSKSKPRVPAPPSKKNDHQPARSSCSLPAASIAAVIERNQVNAGKCEPFALTRCKSEPMSTAAAKLMPESC